MIQLFSIRMIRPVGFGYKDDNHVFLSLYEKQQGGNIYQRKKTQLIFFKENYFIAKQVCI